MEGDAMKPNQTCRLCNGCGVICERCEEPGKVCRCPEWEALRRMCRPCNGTGVEKDIKAPPPKKGVGDDHVQ